MTADCVCHDEPAASPGSRGMGMLSELDTSLPARRAGGQLQGSRVSSFETLSWPGGRRDTISRGKLNADSLCADEPVTNRWSDDPQVIIRAAIDGASPTSERHPVSSPSIV